MSLFPDEVEVAIDGDKVYVRCNRHNYYGSLTKPPLASGCQACWTAWMFVRLGGKMFREGEDELFEAVLRDAAASEESGKWDLHLFRRPKIQIEKGN